MYKRQARGLRGRAPDALAGDGGVGRDRISIARGSLPFGGRVEICVRARDLHVDSVGELGEDALAILLLSMN